MCKKQQYLQYYTIFLPGSSFSTQSPRCVENKDTPQNHLETAGHSRHQRSIRNNTAPDDFQLYKISTRVFVFYTIPWCVITSYRPIAKFIVSRCAFCKLQRNFGFFCSVNNWLSGPLRKHGHGLWFVIGGFRSVLFVSCFKVCCFVIILFRAIIDWFKVCFADFSDLSYSCH